jgi:cytochrome c oxidase subunit 2
MKIDAVPGIDTHLRVTTTDRLGEYPVVCAELCGLGHATMRQTAHVVSREDFDARLAELARGGERGGGGGGGGEEETDGETLFTDAAQPQTCDSCHTLSAAGATGATGPNLDEVLAGKSEEEIRESIVDPDAQVTEGFNAGLMPSYGETLSEEQVDALVQYLMEVSGG